MSDGGNSNSGADQPGLPPRSEAETLREIARRIREGEVERAAARAVATVDAGAAAVAATSAIADTAALPSLASRVSKLAHELRTPLSAIVAAAEIMRDERLGPIGSAHYRGYAADIFDSARHALSVINGMLEAGSGEGARSNLAAPQQFAEIDLNALAERTASVMLPLAGKAGLRLETALQPRLPHVVADATSIRQMLLNILTNALKFTAAGGEVVLATHYTLDGPVRVSVADTGAGMSADAIRRLLDADNPPLPGPRPAGGLGLGLPLVRTLAAANGADVDIASAEGKGTVVTLSFAKDRVIPV